MASRTAIFTGLAEQLPRDAVWVTSGLRRTHETAAAIIQAGLPGPERIPGPESVTVDDLAEQHLGEWQGLAYEDLDRLRAGDFHRSGMRPRMKPLREARASSPSSSGFRGQSTT